MANMQTALPAEPPPVQAPSPINIGVTIREFRLQRGLSQGDIEKRTGLLRCYLSRVENGHTVPSLDTLQKIAISLDLPLSQFFAEDPIREVPAFRLNEDEIRFLTQVQRYAANLTESDRRLLLAMVRKFAATVTTSIS
jgi:transcriptional regulator with XRE-family HTH domain